MFSVQQTNPDQWVAAVQLRQHVSHRRTFFYLEQLILKHDAAIRAIRIKQRDRGIDFFFRNRSHAVKFVEFVQKVVPIKSRHDKGQVPHDTKSNKDNNKYTFSVEICPVYREDLVCLPPKLAASLGNLSPIVLCTKFSNNIMLLDPQTLRHCYFDGEQYWRQPFTSLLSSKQLVEYVVLDVDQISSPVNVGGSRFVLADVQVARVSDFGKNDTMFFVRTHLGHLLNSGDYALGYDLNTANSNNMDLDKYKGLVVPEVVLVKKSYEEKRRKKRGNSRPWKLKSLNMEVDLSDTKGRVDKEKMNNEYEQFLRDLEENPELRFNISLYQNKEYQPSEMTDGEEDVPSVPLEELLAHLELNEKEGENEGIRWTDDAIKCFLETCIEEVHKVGRNGAGSLRRKSWAKLATKLDEVCHMKLTRKQLENQFDYLKSKYSGWVYLKNRTGNVYDPVTNKFNLSNQEWEDFFKGHPTAKMLRTSPLLFPKLCIALFERTSATGARAYAPSSTRKRSGISSSFSSCIQTLSSQAGSRPKKKTKFNLDDMAMITLKALASQHVGSNIKACVVRLETLGIEQMNPLYSAAFDIFGHSTSLRDAWLNMPPNPELLKQWILMTAKTLGFME